MPAVKHPTLAFPAVKEPFGRKNICMVVQISCLLLHYMQMHQVVPAISITALPHLLYISFYTQSTPPHMSYA